MRQRGVIKGLVGARVRSKRLPLTSALETIEQLAIDSELRMGVPVQAEAKECLICMAEPRAVRFSCGHSLCCEKCADVLVARNAPCPSCRANFVIVARGEQIGHEQTFVSSV